MKQIVWLIFVNFFSFFRRTLIFFYLILNTIIMLFFNFSVTIGIYFIIKNLFISNLNFVIIFFICITPSSDIFLLFRLIFPLVFWEVIKCIWIIIALSSGSLDFFIVVFFLSYFWLENFSTKECIVYLRYLACK